MSRDDKIVLFETSTEYAQQHPCRVTTVTSISSHGELHSFVECIVKSLKSVQILIDPFVHAKITASFQNSSQKKLFDKVVLRGIFQDSEMPEIYVTLISFFIY